MRPIIIKIIPGKAFIKRDLESLSLIIQSILLVRPKIVKIIPLVKHKIPPNRLSNIIMNSCFMALNPILDMARAEFIPVLQLVVNTINTNIKRKWLFFMVIFYM